MENDTNVCCPKCDPADFGFARLVWISDHTAECPDCGHQEIL